MARYRTGSPGSKTPGADALLGGPLSGPRRLWRRTGILVTKEAAVLNAWSGSIEEKPREPGRAPCARWSA
ncbi:hypothetical protein [Streptomyces microflavus]|uniref:hypothetical protein n=1 Tax=Streptomyces microflavus TaxID=1919 RepID=UPI003869053B|nr:hypothetical protein OH770_28735 [Streptomyces microflavus]